MLGRSECAGGASVLRHHREAHFRMLSKLTVRTIPAQARYVPPDIYNGVPGRRTEPSDTKRLHAQIMLLAGKGMSNVDIARRLGVSAPTVGKHRRGRIKLVRVTKT